MARTRVLLLLLAGLGLLSSACADRPRRNPLDPKAGNPLDLADPLQALAGDEAVRLRWDFTGFDDVDAVRLYRARDADGGEPVRFERPPADTAFSDTAVTNGVRYRYRLALEVRGEGEIGITGQALATPGPERGWIADAGSGLVWRLSPDGRRPVFARGRFVSLSTVAVDSTTGDLWVADGGAGLARIDLDGEVHAIATDLHAVGDLSVDGEHRRGWVVDGATVGGFDLDVPGDSLDLVVADAVFSGHVALAASPDGGVWALDRETARVLRFDAGGVRRDEWAGLEGAVDLAASAVCCQAWVLAAGGDSLLHLTPGQKAVGLSSPVPGAVAVAVDDPAIWVAGADGVAAIDAAGAVLHAVAGAPPQVRALVAVAGHAWVAGATSLWKIRADALTYRSELTGFTRVVGLAVDPGR